MRQRRFEGDMMFLRPIRFASFLCVALGCGAPSALAQLVGARFLPGDASRRAPAARSVDTPRPAAPAPRTPLAAPAATVAAAPASSSSEPTYDEGTFTRLEAALLRYSL